MAQTAETKVVSLRQDNPLKSRGLIIPDMPLLNRRHRALLAENKYDGNLVGTLNKLLNSGDKILELGTGFGFTAAFMAAKKGATVNSYDINPDSANAAQSLLNANDITTVTLHNAAFGPRKGSKPVDVYIRKDLTASSLAPIHGEDPDAIVKMTTTDVLNTNTVLKLHKPDVFVLSCEGGEVAALSNADVSNLRAVVVVLNPIATGAAGIATVFRAMDTNGLSYSPRLSKGKLVVFHKGV